MTVEFYRGGTPILPWGDVHEAFVLLRREPAGGNDDYFIVMCPGCHYSDLGLFRTLSEAVAAAIAHRMVHSAHEFGSGVDDF